MRIRSTAARVTTAASAGLLSAALVAGCGSESASDDGASGESSGPPPAKVVEAANTKTLQEKTAHLSLKTVVTQGGRTVNVDGHGVIDLRDGTSSLEVGEGGERLEQRVVDEVLYQKPPKEAAAQLPAGKTWTRIDVGKLGAAGGGRLGDPADTLAFTQGVSGDGVKELGREKVGGTPTTHYRVTLDIEKLARGDAQQEKELREQLGEDVPVDLWTDEDGVMRRMATQLTIDPPKEADAGGKAEVKTTVELSGFGTEVDVEAPPAAKTEDVTEEVAQGGGTAL
ncbi:hypothetical protein [Streptomyces xiaopingdaonensis]|uniref:hypothetical protein n=1 Tax=Streptomyces xiaopingdaonensis TaxID=1565415 RepID=UPI001ED8DC33|nr:hypothetical protein [Streptomyces xiaopingdaonensis]